MHWDMPIQKAESQVAASKGFKDEEAMHRDTNESLQRKITLLESELDVAEKNLKDTTEK